MHVRILLAADDQSDTRAWLSAALERRPDKAEILYAGEPVRFREMLHEGDFDVVVAHEAVPWSDGLSILEEVKARFPECPVIVLTEDERTVVEALRAGASDGVLRSPKNADHLVTAIRLALRRADRNRRAAGTERRLRALLNRLHLGVFHATLEGRIVEANPAFLGLLGLASWAEAKRIDLHRLCCPSEDRAQMLARLTTVGHIEGREIELCREDGRRVWLRITQTLRRSRDGQAGIEGLVEDITDRKRNEQELYRAAFHDALTGLPNRRMVAEHVKLALARTQRHPEYPFAVLLLDLDRFKVLNDSLGHVCGDDLLLAVADRLRQCVRPSDIVSRFGGDEFLIVLDYVDGVKGTTRASERIQAELKKPFDLHGQEVFITASIGVTLAEKGEKLAEDLIREADTALYRAKAQGRARSAIFDAAMHQETLEWLQLETDLRKAVECGGFDLHYQPIVRLDTGQVAGLEALVRWPHPSQQLLPPARFIPLAEETGLIVHIGRWVLHHACRCAHRLQEQLADGAPRYVSVNLSARQFAQPDLVEQIVETLARTELDPSCLKLELTESTLMENVASAADRIVRLKEIGVGLYLDDFGTGYSSLGYLCHFPIEGLKIDRSFVSAHDGDNPTGRHVRQSEIVQAIASLAQSLGMVVIAEGVETAEQLQQLQALKCQFAQGYYLSRPLDADSIAGFLASRAGPAGTSPVGPVAS